MSAVPTGALSLDLALGVGGLRKAASSRCSGPESSGKTTMLYHVLASAQRMGGICAFIDAEHAMDPAYAKRIGVDIDELLVSQPDHGEQALEIADLLIRSGAVDVVAIDSVAALTPKAELEGAMGDQTVGLQARMMSQAMRKLAGNLNRANTLCVFTNQIREKVGVMFGSPETQPGGRALKFYSSAPRHPAHRDAQGGHRSGGQPGAGQGRQEQGRARRSARPSSTSSTARASPPRAVCSTWGSSTTSSRSRARSSPTATSGSARGATTPRATSASTPRWREEIERKIYEATGAEPAASVVDLSERAPGGEEQPPEAEAEEEQAA